MKIKNPLNNSMLRKHKIGTTRQKDFYRDASTLVESRLYLGLLCTHADCDVTKMTVLSPNDCVASSISNFDS